MDIFSTKICGTERETEQQITVHSNYFTECERK